eukprot:scaffold7602_cov123-Isochrysis_galbana.AAC.7
MRARPGFCVVGRWIGHHCFTCGSLLFAPPHDNPPSLAGEEDPIPSAQKQKQAHFPSTWRRGKQGRHKGAGKGTYTSCSEGGGPLRGGLPTPLSGA